MSYFKVLLGADPPQVLTAGHLPPIVKGLAFAHPCTPIFSFISILSVRIYEHFVIQTTSLISMRL